MIHQSVVFAGCFQYSAVGMWIILFTLELLFSGVTYLWFTSTPVFNRFYRDYGSRTVHTVFRILEPVH